MLGVGRSLALLRKAAGLTDKDRGEVFSCTCAPRNGQSRSWKVCPYFTNEPETKRGHWREQFKKDQPLYLELGCGKGVSTAAMVRDNLDINYVAMDITCNVLGDTRRNMEAAFAGEPVENVIIARYDISYIEKVFAPEDRVERIYINFCNPWTKRPKYAKRRLTHPRQLMQYREFLVDGAKSGLRRTTRRCLPSPCRILRHAALSFAIRPKICMPRASSQITSASMK